MLVLHMLVLLGSPLVPSPHYCPLSSHLHSFYSLLFYTFIPCHFGQTVLRFCTTPFHTPMISNPTFSTLSYLHPKLSTPSYTPRYTHSYLLQVIYYKFSTPKFFTPKCVCVILLCVSILDRKVCLACTRSLAFTARLSNLFEHHLWPRALLELLGR
jgi:hypothetical protein